MINTGKLEAFVIEAIRDRFLTEELHHYPRGSDIMLTNSPRLRPGAEDAEKVIGGLIPVKLGYLV